MPLAGTRLGSNKHRGAPNTPKRVTSGGAVVFYNGSGQEYGLSTGCGTVANTARAIVKYNSPPAVRKVCGQQKRGEVHVVLLTG